MPSLSHKILVQINQFERKATLYSQTGSKRLNEKILIEHEYHREKANLLELIIDLMPDEEWDIGGI